MAIPKLDLTKGSLTDKSQYDPAKQVEGYKKRLELSGLDPEQETDDRSWLEKALNLTPDQNVFFDIFEVLERPQQALFNGWKAQQEGRDVGEAMKAGITGNDVVRFKEILHNYGMTDSAEKFGVDDVAGFLGDILVDPIDIPLIPVKGATTAAKVAKGALEVADTAGDVAKAAKATTKFISPIEGAFKITAKGGKAVMKGTDKVLTSVLTKLDEYGDAAKSTKDALVSLENYKNVKASVQRVFDAAKKIPEGIMEKFRKNRGDTVWEKKNLNFVQKYFVKKKLTPLAEQAGMGLDEFGEAVQGLIEYRKYRPNTTLRELFLKGRIKSTPLDADTFEYATKFINEYLPGYSKNIDELFDKSTLENGIDVWHIKSDKADDLRNSLRKIYEQDFPEEFLDLTEDLGVKQLGEVPNIESISYQRSSLKDIADNQFKAPQFYSTEQRQYFEELMQNNIFMKAADESEQLIHNILERIDRIYGTALTQGTPEGYVPHSATAERKAAGFRKPKDIEAIDGKQLKGNVHSFSGRKYKMSAVEANMIYRDKVKRYLANPNLSDATRKYWESQKGIKAFETAINSSLDDFIEATPTFARDIKNIDEVLIGATLKDESILRPLANHEKVHAGYQQVGRDVLEKKIKGLSKYVPEETAKRFDDFIKDLPKSETGQYMMDSTVFEMIGRLGNQKDMTVWMQLLDKINNTFKKFKLLSPGFQMRNWIGNSSNMFLAGMSPDDIVKNYSKANKIFQDAPKIMEKVAEKSVDGVDDLTKFLSKAEIEKYEYYQKFVQNGFGDVSKEVWDMEKIIEENGLKDKKDIVDIVTEKNFAANQRADERFRLAAMMWAEKNPDIVARTGRKSPAEFVRHVLFDPNDLSGTERDVLKRLVPFYTFTKKNLAFQMQNLFNNPRKYNQLRKTVRGTWDAFADIDVNDIEEYKKENFWIPVPFINSKDGKYSAIKVNLPMGDLAEFVESPGKKLLASLSPVVRAPFELAANKQIYTGMDIQDFEGQRGYLMPELFNRKQEYVVSQLGLDVPLSLGMDIGRTGYQAATGGLKGQSFGEVARGAFGRSIFSSGSVESAQRSKAYQELQEMQELMKYYKQEGVDILTLAEAENRNITTSSLGARLKELIRG